MASAGGRRVLSTSRVRLYDAIRSAHLERAATWSPAAIVYRRTRYDLHPDLLRNAEVVRAGRGSAAALIARSRVDQLEINEPLMRSSVFGAALAVAALRLAARLGRRSRPRVVAYAIENCDPFAGQPRGVRRARWAVDRVLAGFLWTQLDRIAYGSRSAQEVYAQRFRSRRGPEAMVIPALPAAPSKRPPSDRGHRVIFVGSFVRRKGILTLLEAWPDVAADLPDATLTIIGKGPLEGQVRAIAAREGAVEVLTDPSRARLREELLRSRVLVLPSRRTPQWREQVGLPIVEALEAGCEIVTTDETGLAGWLRDHGHAVVPESAVDTALAAAIRDRLRGQPLDVVASLPARDGRTVADEWLFA